MAGLRVFQYPHSPANPYQDLMANQLEGLGLTMDYAKSLVDLNFQVLRRRMDVLHLHWTHVPREASRIETAARYGLFALALCAARLRGIGIVWTVHNAKAHEAGRALSDWFHAVTAGALANRVIVQGPAGARVAIERFRVKPAKIATVKHGNYAGIIKPCLPRDGAGPRRFLAWGQIRAYKGFADLAETFAGSNLNAELTICGASVDEGETARLADIARASPKVTVRPKYLDDAELNGELCRADFVVLPYQDVLTSGALLMSLTALRPVIVPRIGDLEAYVDDSAAIFYDARNAAGVFDAMQKACSLDPKTLQQMCNAACQAAERHSREGAAEATLAEYLGALAPPSRALDGGCATTASPASWPVTGAGGSRPDSAPRPRASKPWPAP